MIDCPRAQPDTKVCVVADGETAYAINKYFDPVCPSCQAGPADTGVAVDNKKWLELVKKHIAKKRAEVQARRQKEKQEQTNERGRRKGK